jgi:hypothetical protein
MQIYYKMVWQIELQVRGTRQLYPKGLADRTVSQAYQTDLIKGSGRWNCLKGLSDRSTPKAWHTELGQPVSSNPKACQKEM